MTDVNTEFAQYGLFACMKEKKFVGANMLDPQFDGKCPSDGTDLQEVDLEKPVCPRCGSPLAAEQSKPLSAGDATAE